MALPFAPNRLQHGTLGAPLLAVRALRRSLLYYQRGLGFALLARSPGKAVLGAGGRPLVALCERPGSLPPPAGATGLYHLAVRLATRRDLATLLYRAVAKGIPLEGAADHGVSEALYFRDPDGHGLELYHDRPRACWEGRVAERLTTTALSFESLLGELGRRPAEPAGLGPGATVGHLHLKVSALEEAVAFYKDLFGLALTATYGRRAAFLSWDGYHHHLGLNTWESAGGMPPPAGSTALVHATLLFPQRTALEAVLERAQAVGAGPERVAAGWEVGDPAGNRWLFMVG